MGNCAQAEFEKKKKNPTVRKQVLRGKGASLMKLTVTAFPKLNPEQLVCRELPAPGYCFLFLFNKAVM